MRKINHIEGTATNGDRVHVNTYYDRDWNEYVSKLFVNGMHQEPADNHTDDKQDALGTAKAMLQHATGAAA